MNRELRLQLTLSPRAVVGFVLAAALLVWPWLPGVPYSVMGDAIVAGQYAIVAVSLVLLIGWVGQISIAQAALVGIGAYSTGLVSRGMNIPFPGNLAFGAVAAGVAAGILGIVALRVRGLYLAVATLIFSYVSDEFLFRQEWFAGHGGTSVITQPIIGKAGGYPAFDLSDRRIFYYVVWACAAAIFYALANLRSSKTGRAFFAVRGSEVAAASLGIDVVRYKLLAFVISGMLAGVAGNLLIVGQLAVTQEEFSLTTSLFYLSIAVVGGLSSLGGAAAAALVFAGLQEAFFRIHALNGLLDIVSAGLLVTVLLLYRGGLSAIPTSASRRWQQVKALARRRAVDPEELDLVGVADGSASPATAGGDDAEVEAPAGGEEHKVLPLEHPQPARPAADLALGRAGRPEVIAAEGVTVRFGGLVANDDVSVSVREGEIVGLIGPNGAGKTTFFNAIAGLNQPAAGTVHIFGTDVTALPVHERAKLGVARTFQAIQLFGQLTVLENLMVATHLQNHTGVVAHLVGAERSIKADLAARRRVLDALELIGLTAIGDKVVRDLPFGTLRMVEVARAVVTGAKLLMLDEPASGLDNVETRRLSELLVRLRQELDITILVIEHDVPFVTGISDYMYVLDRGRLLASGTPQQIQRNEEVVAAYLGHASADAVPAQVSS